MLFEYGRRGERRDLIMPTKPKRPCNEAGCVEVTDDRYCETHKHKAKERHKLYDKYQRDQKARAFYHSPEWGRTRQQVLMRDHGLCQHCLLEKRITMADMVHHRFPIKTHWNFRLVLSNLVSLCNACHAKVDHAKI
jgi:5-methylcytosine-specific restriction protein A